MVTGVFILICGGDEAGRGALIGPLVVSLVVFKKGSEKRLVEMGVRDSKLLNTKRREELYKVINELAIDTKVAKIEPLQINEMMRNKISLNELEAMHFSRLFDKLQTDVDLMYLDSPDVIEEKFGIRVNMLTTKHTKVAGVKSAIEKGVKYTKIVSEHKADTKYTIVSAASIIAKVTRDREMKKIGKKLGIDIGSGYPSDRYTIEAVRNHMKGGLLKDYIRERWATMDKIRQTRLTTFGFNALDTEP